jgi:hypothetical protein
MKDNTELIERYLHAVKFWLPRAQRDDIAAELSEDLHARIEDQEAALGRALSRDELAALLKTSGPPMVVASRYQPQQSLIGPLLFPVYLFILKIVALCYFIPWLLLGVASLFSSHKYQAAHPFVQGVFSIPGHMPVSLLTYFAIVTIIFAIIERVTARQTCGSVLNKWDPLKLPAVRDPRRIKRANSVAEIIFNVFFAAWWIDAMSSRILFTAAGVHIVVAQGWRICYWTLLLTCLVNVALAVANLLRPCWTMLRGLIRLAVDCTGAALFCWFLKARLLLDISAPSIPAARAGEVVSAINATMASLYPFAVAACILIVAIADLPRLVRRKPTPGNFAAFPLGSTAKPTL